MTVVPGTSQGGVISIDDVLKNTSAEDIVLQAGAKYLIDNNIRIFNHSIQTISKFSDQLHLEPSPEGLSLKALNSSKSAFASIRFTRRFFSDCDVVKIDATANNLCRISMRSALAIFGRCGTQSDRMQLSCKLQVDPRADYFIAQTSYKHYVTKCYVVPFRDCVVTYKHLFNDKSKLLNRLTLKARTLLTVLSQIGSDLDEVKLVATPDRFSIERFFTIDEDRARVRRTAATIDLDVFERYNLRHSSEVAVNLKELKAVLTFADATGMSVNLHFDQPGRPIIVAVEENADFVAEFVLATFEGVQNGFHDNAVEEQVAEVPQSTEGQSAISAAVVAEETEQNILLQPQYKGMGGDYFEPVLPPDIYNHSSLGLGDGDHAKPNEGVANADDAKRSDDVADASQKNDALNNNEFAAADDEVLGGEPMESFHVVHDKSIDGEALLVDLELNENEICASAPAFVNIDTSVIETRTMDLSPLRSGLKEVGEIPSSENTCDSRECARVVIDEDAGFNLSSWSSKQKQLLDKENLTSDQMATMYAELSALEMPCTSVATPKHEMAGPAATSSPIYDIINLSCSPTVYLEGERAFNIRLAESQLERLHQINREMPSQSQQDHEPSTSFVGRLLDAAVEKTKPNESRGESLVSETSFTEEAGAAPVNLRTGNLAPAGHVFGKSPSMEEPFFNNFSPNVTELDRLESAVEQLQNRFGGFKRRPNTQHFSQERVDLAEQHQFNLFNASQGWLDMTQSDRVVELDEFIQRVQSPQQPDSASRETQFRQQKKAQDSREKEEEWSKQTRNSMFESNNKNINLLKKTSAVVLEATRLPQRQNDTVKEIPLTSRSETNTLTSVSRPMTAVSRPLAEIERELHSDNSLDQPLIVETMQPPVASAIHNISDDLIIVADSGRPSKNLRDSSSRKKPTTANTSNVCNRFCLDEESNEHLLASGGFRHEAAPTKLAIKATTSARRIPEPIGESFQVPASHTQQKRRPNDSQRTVAGAVTSSTSSVLLLEEDYDCDGGWLRKPNTQRSGTRGILPSKNPPVKKSHVKRPTKMMNDELDDELEGILTSVNDFRNERRRATYLRDKSTPGDENGRQRKRPSVAMNGASSTTTTSILRPLRKKPTMADQLTRQSSPPSRIEPPAVVVITSPTKKHTRE